jgi:hypothetical protein
MLSITSIETKFVQLPTTLTVSTGIGNPSADPVFMAFLSTKAEPVSGDWKTGSWVQSASGGWLAQCLVGPGTGGVITLAKGQYYVWIKIVDPTETIEECVALLAVT